VKQSGVGLALIISVFIASVLQLVPVSGYLLVLKPNFLLLVVIGWIIFRPSQCGIGFAAFTGPIGMHVLLFSAVGAIPLYLSGWLVYFSLIHRCLFVFFLIILAEFIRNILLLMWEIPMDYSYILMTALASAAVWPAIDRLLIRVNRKR
jgi:rod shape-determining protein MreD